MKFPKFLKVAVLSEIVENKINESTTVTREVFSGVDHQFTEILSQALRFSYKLVTASDGEMGRPLPDGNWTGMVGMVQRGDADLVVSILSITEQRLQVIDFSYPFHRSRITFATRNPVYTPQLTSFLRPFSFEVWMLTLISLFTMPILFYMFFGRKYPFQKLILAAYSTLVQKNVTIHPKAGREYVLISSWKISAMFLSYCYTAVLLAFLTVPPLYGVRTIPELAREVSAGKYECVTYPGTFFPKALATSKDPYARIIAHSLQQGKVSRDIDEVLGNTRSPKVPAFVVGEDPLLPFKYKYFISQDEFLPALRSVAMRKDFCCKSQLDVVIGRVWASGIYRKLVADAAFIESLKKYPESSHTASETRERKLSIEDFEGAFLLLVIGYTAATLVLAVELIFSWSRAFTKVLRVRRKW